MFQNIINLFLNKPPSSPDIKPTRCEQCQGIGLVKKNTQNISASTFKLSNKLPAI